MGFISQLPFLQLLPMIPTFPLFVRIITPVKPITFNLVKAYFNVHLDEFIYLFIFLRNEFILFIK